MDISNYTSYKNIYEDYKKVYNLPVIQTYFYQDDYHAMDYCIVRDFIALIIPFGDPEELLLANKIFVKNSLVSYSKMFTDLLGGSVDDDGNFMSSALSIAKEKIKNKRLRLEELYPIALIENIFIYNGKNHSHYGVVFVARIPKGQNLNSSSYVSKSLADEFYFSNPHNKILFELAKIYINNYRIDRKILSEIAYSRSRNAERAKSEKAKYLAKNNISLDDYIAFKKQVVEDIERDSPNYIIDIACGDDDIIYDFLNIKDNIHVFANDIAIAYMENYHSKQEHFMDINFSCLDAINAPFKDNVFDILFCKNLFHHLPKGEINNFIENALRISKKMVVIEILEYREQNELGKKIHDEFYCKILKEGRGKDYLSSKKIEKLFKNYHITINKTVNTNNGTYQYLWIQKER